MALKSALIKQSSDLKNPMAIIALLFYFLVQTSCAFRPIKRSKNITYLVAKNGDAEQKLNVFAPRNKKKPKPVLIHFYGGNWTSGRRSLYNFFGSRWARKNVVTVIPDYPKYPDAKYDEMATDAALAVKWATEHIKDYGGDPERIYVSGHSAGGQLAALIALREDYFRKLNLNKPVKGIILIDAAGIDMYGYLKEVDNGPNDSYLDIFSKDTNVQKQASPLFQLHKDMPPMLLYMGGRTYSSIKIGYRKLVDSLNLYQSPYTYHYLRRKKHVPMITQFFNSYGARYKEIKRFMNGEYLRKNSSQSFD